MKKLSLRARLSACRLFNRETVPKLAPARLFALAAIFISITAVFVLGADEQLSLENLWEQSQELLLWTDKNRLLAGGIYFMAYVLVVVLFPPGAIYMTLGGGFFFGTITAMVLVITAATTGAMIAFLIARYCLSDYLHAKMGSSILKLKAGFQDNAVNYMLFLRLVPLFPFWLVNVVPAFLDVSLRKYVMGTFFGIIPACAVYCSVGNGLGEVFDAGSIPELGTIFRPEILGPIIGLAFLSLVPIGYKSLKTFSQSTKADE